MATLANLRSDITNAVDQLRGKVMAMRSAGQHLVARQLADSVRVIAQEVDAYKSPDESLMEAFLQSQLKRLEALK